MTWDCCTLLRWTWLSHGITSRPLLVWMPTPGPVAYQLQSGFFTSRVMSAGLLQVAPSPSLFVIHTVRVPLLVPPTIMDCVSLPRLCVIKSQTIPVFRSTTGHGLPQVLTPSFQTNCVLPHVLPPSWLRLTSRPMAPASPRPFLRPSQNASSTPFFVVINAGMR